MCGIVGGFRAETYNDITPEAQNEILRIVTVELLLLTEERGVDATGFALLFEDGNMRGMKHGEKASKVVQDFNRDEKNNFLALMDIWKYYKNPANIVMGHCRKKTTGLATDNRNNHPFKVGNIFGVHNGIIENHFKIERLLKEEEKIEVGREGTVDSEMIFHLLSRATKKEKIMTLAQAEWTVDRLQGKYAVMAANVCNPYQVMLFRDGRPVEVALSRPAGLIFVASDKKFFETALFRYRRIKEYYGLDYLPDLELTVATMPDDHAWIFNLAHKIEETTSVNDLVEAKKLPWLSARNKDWQNTVVNHFNNRRHDNWRGPGAADPLKNKKDEDKKDEDKKTDVDPTISGRNCQHLKDNDKDGGWKPGRMWCSKIRKYIDKPNGGTEEKDEKKVHGTQQRQTQQRQPVLIPDSEVPKDVQEDINEDVAIYGNVEFKDMSSYVIVPESSGKDKSRASDSKRRKVKGNAVKSVDASEIVDDEKKSTLIDIVKMYVKRHGHFNSLPEALVAAEIKEEKLLGVFDFKVIASRVRQKAVEQGFKDGYEAAMAQNESTSGYTNEAMQKALVKQTSKKKKAEWRIQKLKALALALIGSVPIHVQLDDIFLHDLDKNYGPHYSLTMEETVDLFSDYEKQARFFHIANAQLRREDRVRKEQAAEAKIRKERAIEEAEAKE